MGGLWEVPVSQACALTWTGHLQALMPSSKSCPSEGAGQGEGDVMMRRVVRVYICPGGAWIAPRLDMFPKAALLGVLAIRVILTVRLRPHSKGLPSPGGKARALW